MLTFILLNCRRGGSVVFYLYKCILTASGQLLRIDRIMLHPHSYRQYSDVCGYAGDLCCIYTLFHLVFECGRDSTSSASQDRFGWLLRSLMETARRYISAAPLPHIYCAANPILLLLADLGLYIDELSQPKLNIVNYSGKAGKLI